jgi:hypothetical protein
VFWSGTRDEWMHLYDVTVMVPQPAAVLIEVPAR